MDTPSTVSNPAKEDHARTRLHRGKMRQIPAHSTLNADLPITQEEIQYVLAALGAEFLLLFQEIDR